MMTRRYSRVARTAQAGSLKNRQDMTHYWCNRGSNPMSTIPPKMGTQTTISTGGLRTASRDLSGRRAQPRRHQQG